MVTEKQVWKKLKTVMDPEMMINIVDLGLIYEVKVNQEEDGTGKVKILMTLTSPGCPLAAVFDELVGQPIRGMKEVSGCEIQITFDPPWSMAKMTEEARAELGFF